MTFTRIFFPAFDERVKLSRSKGSDDWMVQKGAKILYMGSKDKCKAYLSNH